MYGRSGGAVVGFSEAFVGFSGGVKGGVGGGVGPILEADFDRDRMRSRMDFDLDCMRSNSDTNSDSDWEFLAEGVVGDGGGVGGVGSAAPTVFDRQSMGGLTRSSHGIPKIMEWEPIDATRKVSRCLTFAMMYDKVVWHVVWVSNAPFARLTAVGIHGSVLRDRC